MQEFVRIFMLFAVFFVVFSAASSYYYLHSGSEKREELIAKMADSLSEQSERMDHYIQKVYTASYALLTSDHFTAQLAKPQEVLSNLAVVDSLKNLNYSIYDHVVRIFLMSPDSRLFYTGGICEADTYFNELYRYSLYRADSWRAVAGSSEKMQVLPSDSVYEKYGNTSRVIVPVLVSNQVAGQRWILVTEVSAQSMLKQFTDSRVDAAQQFLCVDSSGRVVFQSGSADFTQQALPAADQHVTTILNRYKSGREEYILTCRKGSGNLTYYSMISTSALDFAVNEMNRPTLFFLLSSMVMFFVITLFYAKHFYKSFYSVIQLSKRIQTAETMRTTNFSLKQLDKIDSFYREKELAFQKSCDFLIRQIVYMGENVREQGFQENFLRNAGLYERGFKSLALKFTFTQAYYESFGDDEQELIAASLFLLVQGMIQDSVSSYVTEYAPGRILCYYNGVPGVQKALEGMFEALKGIFKYDSDLCNIYGGLSSACSGESCVYNATMEALTVIEYADAQDNKMQAFCSREVSFAPVYNGKRRNKLMVLLHTGSAAEIFDFIRELDACASEQRLYYPLYRRMYLQLEDTGREFFYSLKNSNDVSAKWQELMKGQKEYEHSIRTYKSSKLQICHFLLLCAGKRSPEEKSQADADEILRYIEAHLHEDIYLEKVSMDMELSPKYVSKLVREKTGATVSGYIAQARINKAKRLLWETAHHVAAVGEMVGFENRTTFFRTFKKFEGISPNDYRKTRPQ